MTVALDPQDDTLYEGSSAQASITVAGGTDVLVVPTSAVRSDGTTRTVSVLSDGKVTVVTVEVGAVGQETTEITAGLEAGDEVVLADLSQEMVTDEESSSGLTGLGDSGSTQRDSRFPDGASSPAAAREARRAADEERVRRYAVGTLVTVVRRNAASSSAVTACRSCVRTRSSPVPTSSSPPSAVTRTRPRRTWMLAAGARCARRARRPRRSR
ncbi:efflux RND transporter periplasmic adaptor subunit [Oerskovia sp. M15]